MLLYFYSEAKYKLFKIAGVLHNKQVTGYFFIVAN